MSKLYLVDESNISFRPTTAAEAVILFNRLKRKTAISWDHVPELLQNLARDLSPDEHDVFCNWIINPNQIKPGPPGYFHEICRADTPAPLVLDQDDEKCPVVPELFVPSARCHTTDCDS